MAQRILKIIMNGVTGRMGRTQVTSERAPAVKAALAAVSQANAIIELFKSRNLGMVIDVYHVWWDPAVYSEIERASDHIFGFHVNDWIVPVPDMLNGSRHNGRRCHCD
jgi:sugar phosphate isomerase/epimerase